MDALTLLVLILLGLRLVAMTLLVLLVWSPGTRKPKPAFDPCLAPYVLRRSAPSPEGKLVSELGTGAIDRLRYQREMAAVAAADVRTHPLVVPPDGRPSS